MSVSQEMIQHWILNIAIEYSRRLSDFFPFVEGSLLNVIEIPEATRHDYANAFLALRDAGLIRAYPIENDGRDTVNVARSAVGTILEKRLRLPQVTSKTRLSRTKRSEPMPSNDPAVPNLRWELTTLGGEAWERLARPDWNRYGPTLTDDHFGDIWSANHDLLMAELGWYRELNYAKVDGGTIRIETLHSYPITYWKVLPLVYHAIFSCTPDADGSGPSDQPEWFQAWWRSLNQWYKKPWELPGWPTSGGK